MNTISRTLQAPRRLAFFHPIRQFIPIVARSRKMLRQARARQFDRLHDGGSEFLAPEVSADRRDKLRPKFVTAALMNPLVTDDGEFLRARRDENQHRVPFPRFVHAESMKFSLPGNQWIDIQLAALNINADLTGSFCFRFTNRSNDPIVLELAEKFLCSHFLTNCRLNHRRRNFRHRR